MKLFTKAILNKIPKIGDTSELEAKDISVHCKLFNAMGGQTWYLTEYDPETKEAFGFANICGPQFAELGYISIQELEELNRRRVIMLERDRHFGVKNLQEVMDIVKGGGHV